MTDPYRPTYYQERETYQSHSQQPYRPADYTPQSALTLSQNRTPPHSPYGPPAIYAPPLDRDRDRDAYVRTSKQSSRRSHSSDPRYYDRDSYYEDDREERRSRRDKGDRHKRTHSRERSIGATVAGAVGGAALGHKFGGGAVGTVGGLLAGAWGAHELEERVEKHRHRSRSRGGGEERKSIGGLVEEGKKKVENFLNPDSARDRDRKERRRHGYDSGSRSLSRGRYESSEEEEYYERRQRR